MAPFWARKTEPSDQFQYDPAAGSAPQLATPSGPQTGTATFVVEDVYTITGIGTVVVGKLTAGSVPIPCEMRLVPGPGSNTPAAAVTIKSAMAHHRSVSLLEAGVRVGLALRSSQKSQVRKGDLLVPL